ncbi:MAG: SLC13 family permease [Planctomycetaceae bacterium]|nr:SLC13 family permease [Planctomycetaceae bacterium]
MENAPDSLHMLYALGILAVAVVFFVMGKIRTDLVALCALLALLVLGVLDTSEAFTGFSNPIIFTTAGMFVISGAIVRSGLAAVVSQRILGIAGNRVHVLFMMIMLLAAVIGSLVSNTGTVAIMMPIVVSLAMSIDESPSRFLMPLAFMSSIGGMFTLIGNSPNMVVNALYVRAGFPSLHLFSFFPVGVVCFLFGMLVLAPATSYYLSRRKRSAKESVRTGVTHKDLVKKYHLAESTYVLRLSEGSDLAGQSLEDLRLPERYGVLVQEVSRPAEHKGLFQPKNLSFAAGPGVRLQTGDYIRVLGSPTGVQAMVDAGRVEVESHYTGGEGREMFRLGSGGICELVLMSSSRLVKRTVVESNLRAQYGITVLGIQRGNQYLIDAIKDQTMQSGDALLVQGSWTALDRLGDASDMNWVVVGRPKPGLGMVEKIPMVALVLVLMILAMAFNLVPTVVAVMLAATVLVFGGLFKNMDEVYSVVNWETLVLIACLLPMATAMEKTGVVGIFSENMVALSADYGPRVALAAIYAVASVMNIFISTTPVALLVGPVAMQVALGMGYSPLPFLFAVATASSMCFASPFSTPSNALVMSAGRYTFMDYAKIGLPLQFLMGVVMVLVLPWLFPF